MIPGTAKADVAERGRGAVSMRDFFAAQQTFIHIYI
jgi:hypothetical protein